MNATPRPQRASNPYPRSFRRRTALVPLALALALAAGCGGLGGDADDSKPDGVVLAGRTDSPLRGGADGAFSPRSCPPGAVLSGFSADASTKAITSVRGQCSELQIHPKTLQITLAEPTLLAFVDGETKGAFDSTDCMGGVVVGFDGLTAAGIPDRIRQMALHCADVITDGSTIALGLGFAGESTPSIPDMQGASAFERSSCGPNEVATGYVVRTGHLLNALSLQCAEIEFAFE